MHGEGRRLYRLLDDLIKVILCYVGGSKKLDRDTMCIYPGVCVRE